MFGDEVEMVDEAERLLQAGMEQGAAEERRVEAVEFFRESSSDGAEFL